MPKVHILILLISLFSANSCIHYHSDSENIPSCSIASDYTLIIFVDARHLDYRNTQKFLKSLQTQSSANYGRFGHAWILLKGINENGEACVLEGGHSGERGLVNPRYFDGVMDLVDAGDPNPIRYLWSLQSDGYFEQGSGNHTPTYSAKMSLTQEQYTQMLDYINAQTFKDYSITQSQCTSFAANLAAIGGVKLNHETTLQIPQTIQFGGRKMTLWTDPCYSQIKFGTPDALEDSLRAAVRKGYLEPYN